MRTIVTGAASGIGRAVAVKLARDAQDRGGRAQLVLADRLEGRLFELEADLRGSGAEVVTAAADLADPGAPKRIVQTAADAFGGLDALVSNAGIIQLGPLATLAVEEWDQAFAVNTRATFLLAQAAYPMLKESRGAIVATASMAAHDPTPALGAYAPSKAALVMLIRQLACDWGPDGIRSNTVSPGSTRTSIGRPDGTPEPKGARPGRNPLGFISEPEDQAAVIAFLLSPEARFVNGADVLVDGGAHTQLMTMSGMAHAQSAATA